MKLAPNEPYAGERAPISPQELLKFMVEHAALLTALRDIEATLNSEGMTQHVVARQGALDRAREALASIGGHDGKLVVGLRIEVDCENAAFEDKRLRPRVADFLRGVADEIAAYKANVGDEIKVVFDSNGNRTGSYSLRMMVQER